jgi:hypothetical protein
MDLQQENRELRLVLEEQQNAIDLIMSKYRQQVSKLLDSRNLDQKLLNSIDTNTKVREVYALIVFRPHFDFILFYCSFFNIFYSNVCLRVLLHV